MRPILEEDNVPNQIDLLQVFVHDFYLLVKLGGITLSSSLEKHWLSFSSSSSLEILLIAIFFNNFSCLLVRALCVGEESGALGLMSLRSSWEVTLLRT